MQGFFHPQYHRNIGIYIYIHTYTHIGISSKKPTAGFFDDIPIFSDIIGIQNQQYSNLFFANNGDMYRNV
jgi:hypothetical protein